MMVSKIKTKWFIVLLALTALIVCWFYWAYAGYPYGRPVLVTINSKEYLIPSRYITARDSRGWWIGFGIDVLLPDMKPMTLMNGREFVKPGFNDIYRIGIAEGNEDFPQRLFDTIDEQSINRVVRGADYGSLHGYYPIEKVELPGRTVSDVFIHNEGSKITDTLFCTQEGRQGINGNQANAYCAHHFYHDGLRYSATFGRAHLSDWAINKQKLLTLMASFKQVAAAAPTE